MKMNNQKMVSIIIVNYKDPSDTLDLLNCLAEITYSNFETIIVDNGTDVDRTEQFQSRLGGVKVYNTTENLGFAGGVNVGITKASGDYILLLNNDTIVESGFIEPMVETLNVHKEVGMLSPRILFHDGSNTIQYAGATNISSWLGRGKKIGFGRIDSLEFSQSKETGLCNGACLMIRKNVIDDVGSFSEDYFMYYEEHDFCLRAKRYGWKAFYVANSRIYHKQSRSMGRENPLKQYYLSRNRILFMRRFSKGFSLFFFYCYYTLLQLPVSVTRHLLKGQMASAKYVFKGLIWNIRN